MENTVTTNTPNSQNNKNSRPKTAKALFKSTRNVRHFENNKTEKITESNNENSNVSKNEINDLTLEVFDTKVHNLKNINLLEKDIHNLYKWEHLFNNFRPINCYTTIKSNKDKEEKEEIKNEEFKSPILLVDLPEEQMNLFFGRNTNYESSRNKKINCDLRQSLSKGRINSYNASKTNNNISSNHNNIRPISMYSPRIDNSCYYYSSTFSDYYKEDFKSFCNKMPILKAKLKIYPEKLKTEISKHNKNIIKKERLLNELLSTEDIYISKQDLVIAAQRKNTTPLLKSIFKQNYPGVEVIKENPKLYLKTMKPYGNSNGKIDYFQNDRWKFTNEIIKMRNNNKKQNNKNNNYSYRPKHKKLFLSYYDKNDPYIVLFNKKVEKNINKNKQILNKDINLFQNKKNDNNIQSKNDIKIGVKNDTLDNKEFDSNKSLSDEIQIFLKSKLGHENSEKYDNSLKKEEITKNIEKKDINENEYEAENTPIISSQINTKNKNEKKRDLKLYSSTLNNLGAKDENLYIDYSSSNRFPLKTSSNVGNTSYNKINRMIQEKKLINKLKLDYSLTQSKATKKSTKLNTNTNTNTNMTTNFTTNIKKNKMLENRKEIDLMYKNKKIKPKKTFSLYESAISEEKNSRSNFYSKSYNHWDKGGNLINDKKNQVNYLLFNNYIHTAFNKDLIYFKKNEENQYFYPMNAYNKLAGKYYHYDDEEKNGKSKNVMHNLFDYSRDEPDNDNDNDNEVTKTEHKKDNDEIYNQFNTSSEKKINFFY